MLVGRLSPQLNREVFTYETTFTLTKVLKTDGQTWDLLHVSLLTTNRTAGDLNYVRVEGTSSQRIKTCRDLLHRESRLSTPFSAIVMLTHPVVSAYKEGSAILGLHPLPEFSILKPWFWFQWWRTPQTILGLYVSFEAENLTFPITSRLLFGRKNALILTKNKP
ncbi:hypothetical protein AVEN_227588-1 [Araneus ventricosus]|uniref:Uncharacterized protein n=1 Tax=Araneus ventricosus TaxID=182803 RepID=A0A4Y2K9D8_ARAVE|nr:hypothetical protein AVEN_227588-1 [Araneus ventricosus]